MTSRPLTHGTLRTAVAVTLAVVGSSTQPAQAGSSRMSSITPAPPAQTMEQATPAVRISHEEFERLLQEGDVVLVDVRPYSAYLQAHLPNAMSIPLDKLEGSLARLRARGTTIVLYCTGPAGAKSGRAANLLRQHGFTRVYCLDGGFERWVGSGRVVIVQPTET